MDAEKGQNHPNLVQSFPQTSRIIPERSHGYWVGSESVCIIVRAVAAHFSPEFPPLQQPSCLNWSHHGF